MHDPSQCVRRREGNILLSGFNEGDILLQQSGAFGQLSLCQALLHPSSLQIHTKDCYQIVRVRFIRREIVAAYGH